jgi:hypothetical protein
MHVAETKAAALAGILTKLERRKAVEQKKIQCAWCESDFPPVELVESRFLGGQVCPRCDADEGSKTLGDIHDRLKRRARGSVEQGIGCLK